MMQRPYSSFGYPIAYPTASGLRYEAYDDIGTSRIFLPLTFWGPKGYQEQKAAPNGTIRYVALPMLHHVFIVRNGHERDFSFQFNVGLHEMYVSIRQSTIFADGTEIDVLRHQLSYIVATALDPDWYATALPVHIMMETKTLDRIYNCTENEAIIENVNPYYEKELTDYTTLLNTEAFASFDMLIESGHLL